MIRMLDAGWPAQTPAGVIADCKALGAGIIGLYDANWSVPSAQKTTAFLDAVDQGGVPVLPICTPSNFPPDTAAQLLGIMVGAGLKHKFCAFDLETYSFPPQDWVSSCIALLHGAGWKVIGYGFQSTKTTYQACGFDYWWGVLNYAQGYGYVPNWCNAFQYYDKLIGPSGATYDGSTVGDALQAAFFADPAPAPSPAPKKEEDMITTIYVSGLGLVSSWVTAAGELLLSTMPVSKTDTAGAEGRWTLGTGFPQQYPSVVVAPDAKGVFVTAVNGKQEAILVQSGEWPWPKNAWNWKAL